MSHLIESFSLYLPELPPALEGLRLLQITDLHLRRLRRMHRHLLDEVAAVEPDLLLLTGDLMQPLGVEGVVADLVGELIDAAEPTVGTFGVWGNHDSHQLRRRLDALPVHWLVNRAAVIDRLPLSILGLDCALTERRLGRADLLAAMLDAARKRDAAESDLPRPGRAAPSPPFQILLAHIPNWLPVAAQFDIPLIFSGHTHGGQIRPPSRIPFYNATPGWPLHLSTGILQAGRTFCVVSRGLGESWLDGLRLFCRPHAPLITLHRTDAAIADTPRAACVHRW